jgi:hypothetical protein
VNFSDLVSSNDRKRLTFERAPPEPDLLIRIWASMFESASWRALS